MANPDIETIIKYIQNGEIFSIDNHGLTINGCGCCADFISNDDLTPEQKDIIAKEAIKRWSVWLIDNKL